MHDFSRTLLFQFPCRIFSQPLLPDPSEIYSHCATSVAGQSTQCAHTIGFLLLPGGLNEKVIKKISQNEVWEQRVQPLLAKLAVERDPRVLLCHDGFGRNAERDAAYQIFFLKKFLGQNADVRTFSFHHGDTATNHAWMQGCDFFYLAGCHEPNELLGSGILCLSSKFYGLSS